MGNQLSSINTFLSTHSLYSIIKSIGYVKFSLLLISITNMPTPLKHWFYYGWLCRLALTTSLFVYSIKYKDSLFISKFILAFFIFRFIQFYSQPCNYKTLNDMHINVLSKLPTLKHDTLITRDNVNLHYYSIGSGKKIILLANGLGGRIYVWEPLLQLLKSKNLYEDYTFVSWDYRGLFDSSSPIVPCRLSIRDHADDMIEILNKLNGNADMLMGYSTGVQIGLQFAALYPERIGKLVLLNGAPGHTLQSALQPIIRIPWMGSILNDALTILHNNTSFIWSPVANIMISYHYYLRIFGCRIHAVYCGNRNAEWLNLQYITDILGVSKDHTINYMRIFQELDSHSLSHILHEINTPTLIICGFFDILTPSYLSYEMARCLPKSNLICYTWSSHFTILEYPTEVASDIMNFLEQGINISDHDFRK